MSIFLRYFHTLRHLRPIQVWYRAFYFFRKKWRQRTGHRYPLHREPAHIESLVFQDFLPAVATWWPSENRFRFLHIEQSFSEKTDWDFAAHGKLWQYNLHYFDCLHQKDLGPAEGFCLMHHFVEHLPDVPAALEPYPTALRIINWVKFLAKHDPVQAHTALDRSLYAQAYVLADHLEYHLLANHLLEDGFGLLFAALRYRDKYLFRRAAQVLDSELPEQILPDGGHYERSPMYHQILLGRMLDLHNLLANNAPLVDALTASAGIAPRCLAELGPRSQAMLGWMQAMTHPDGRMARFNDAVDGIAPAAAELVSYARRLGLEALAPFRGLSASGYFRPDSVVYTLIADAGPVGPDHQPGHAHSDTLSFEMSVGEEPFLVNTGISTYEKNGRRHYERSTAAHNTVTINDCEQSDTWSGHRVGRRARPVVMGHSARQLAAAHTGYDHLLMRHVRQFDCGEAGVRITDSIVPVGRRLMPPHGGRAYFHFHPDVQVVQRAEGLVWGGVAMTFSGFSRISLQPYAYAAGFNRLLPATRAVVEFEQKLETRVKIHLP